MEVDLQQCLRVAREAALAAGAIIKQNFGSGHLGIEQKSSHVDLVTETDKRCEEVIKSMLQQHFPQHKFIGEETAAADGGTVHLTDEPTWMVDPLDGTTNFVHSYPFTCVSIGLAINRVPVVGVVHNPMLGELFQAAQGHGAFLNDQPIKVSSTTDLKAALFATEVGTLRSPETVAAVFDRIQTLTSSMRSVRCCGSCALNLVGVACGRLDAFYEIGFGGCWDVAAGVCILREAGGQVLDPSGCLWDVMSRRVLGSNARLCPAVAKLLAGCKTSSEEPPAPPPPAAAAAAAASSAQNS
ncbi:putative inositol monophosphatase 3 [Scenedesmus sp. NREL 46B-D3]|nr:putative inositol monophosphatase 3 [Scenedesmus sp. NREL 46B-D3]